MADGNVYREDASASQKHRINSTFTGWNAKNGTVDGQNLHAWSNNKIAPNAVAMGFSSADKLYLSLDTGETFAAVSQPVAATYISNDHSFSPGGRLWGIFHDSAGSGDYVFFSGSLGASWSQSLVTPHPANGEEFFNIRCHPTIEGYVVVGATYITSGLGNASIYITLDNGTTWTHHDTGSGIEGCQAYWGASNRIIALLSASIFSDMHIATSDNLNGNYTDRFSFGGASTTSPRLPSDIIFCGGTTFFAQMNSANVDSDTLARSTDGGDNWSLFAVPAGVNVHLHGIAYDSSIDTLYAVYAQNTYSLLNPATAVSASGSWGTLPITPASVGIGWNDVVIVPPNAGPGPGPPPNIGGGPPRIGPFHRRPIETFNRPGPYGPRRPDAL